MIVHRRLATLATLALLSCDQPSAVTRHDPTQLVAAVPPSALVQSHCSLQEFPDGTGSLGLFVAIPVDRTVDGKSPPPASSPAHGTEVYSLECTFDAKGLSAPDTPCWGAKLDVGPLLEGRPLAGGVTPISRTASMEEFRIEERTGQIVRLESFVSQRRMSGNVSRKVTLVVDLARGRVDYASHADFVSQVQEARGQGVCLVRGGSPVVRR